MALDAAVRLLDDKVAVEREANVVRRGALPVEPAAGERRRQIGHAAHHPMSRPKKSAAPSPIACRAAPGSIAASAASGETSLTTLMQPMRCAPTRELVL